MLTNTCVDVKLCIAWGPALPCPAVPCPHSESVMVSGTCGNVLFVSYPSDAATCDAGAIKLFLADVGIPLFVCSQLGLLRRHHTMWDRQDPVVLCSFEVDRVQCEHLLFGQMPVS